MGANAQTAVPTFTTGQVLTADQMNQSARTGVPVFADTTARDAAFGGSGEKTLAEGQLCYLEDSNIVQYYDGAAWATVGPTSASGLVRLTGGAFTAVTSFSLPNSTFTATYRNYRIHIDLTAVTADADFTMRLRASGTDDSTANYRSLLQGLNTTGATGTVVNINSSGATSWNAGEQDAAVIRYALEFDVMSPQIAAPTRCLGQYMYRDKANGDDIIRTGALHFTATTQFDSLSFISSIANSITGYYNVYGYLNS